MNNTDHRAASQITRTIIWTIYSFVYLFRLLTAEGNLSISYELDLQFNPQTNSQPASIKGFNRVQVINHWHKDINKLHFHNVSNAHYDSTDMTTPQTKILSISGPVQLDGSASGVTMAIILDEPLLPKDTILVEIEFETRIASKGNPFAPSVGSRGDTTIYNLIFFQPILEYFYEDGWHLDKHFGAADPHSNTADYQMKFSYPDTFKLGLSGFSAGIDTFDNGMITETCISQGSHSVSAILSNYFERKQINVHGIEVDMLFTPGQSDNVDSLLVMMEDMVPFMESWFGSCPSKRLLCTMSYSLGELAGALATTNYIVYQGNMKSKGTLSHELGHHWFAGSVIANENTEPWLNEGFSEYGSRLWYNERHKESKYRISTKKISFDFWNDLRHFGPESMYWLFSDILGDTIMGPVHLKNEIDWSKLDDMVAVTAPAATIYYKSSNLLTMLQSSLGEDQMRKIMLAYTERYRGKKVTQNSWLNLLEEITGKEISDNFKTAINVAERPDYSISSASSILSNSSEWITKVEVKSKGSWAMPVPYRAYYGDGSVAATGHWNPYHSSDITLKTPKRIRSVSLDPDQRSMDRYRFDNHWPRRFQLQPILGLPGRDQYRIFIRPHYYVDEIGSKQLGIRFKGGLGLHGMPLSTASFKHDINFDITWDRKTGIPQYRFRLKEPLFGSYLHFFKFTVSYHEKNNLQEISATNYLGTTEWYVNGGNAKYFQINSKVRRWIQNFQNQNERNLLYKIKMTYFRQTVEKRTLISLMGANGTSNKLGKSKQLREFRLWTQVDRPLIGRLDFGFSSGFFLVDDQTTNQDISYRTGILPRTWDLRKTALPYRGFTSDDEGYHRTAIPIGFSLGLGKAKRFAIRPLIYTDLIFFENNGGSFSDRIDSLSEDKPSTAFGFGFESRWAMDVGLYFPIWLSNPLIDQKQWDFRAMIRLSKNWE